ncbi:MAG: carboxypeptidase-like regulatory domain-containing protein, partial [Acidobacteria bacterium]|nr:carboxypeptidase-like regulatory domain-containing protein [Acidobacteriota bacterium]
MKMPRASVWLFVLAALVAWPAASHAQEATLAGTVVDSTGGVLPGVPVIAVHTATGNVFEAVSGPAGGFRMPVRAGVYEITAALPGFQTVTLTNVNVLLSATFNATLTLAPATLEETVTVTGEAPLIDTTASTVGANIDPEQMAELPINGRNWMDLALLTPGARRNESGGYV